MQVDVARCGDSELTQRTHPLGIEIDSAKPNNLQDRLLRKNHIVVLTERRGNDSMGGDREDKANCARGCVPRELIGLGEVESVGRVVAQGS
jgi:hypothetical protein